MRIGHGYDVHKLVSDRALILGGIQIPCDVGLLGHSDADVLVHALIDAMLGAAAMGDIGQHFPDNDPNFKGADSCRLLDSVHKMLSERGFSISNADCTVIAQAPKLAPYIPLMREKLSSVLGIELSQLNIKATTEEKLGFTGAMLGIAAHAVVLLDELQ